MPSSRLRGLARLVTLVGAPGVGKTSVAMKVALEMDRHLQDGAWWVALRDAAGPPDAEQTLRRTLGIPDWEDSNPVQAVIDRIAGQEPLVVFDNFEHLMNARSIVSRLLEHSAAKVLVTSREALGLVREHVHLIEPLAFPDPATGPSFEEARASAAVELFSVRAQMSRKDFRVTPSNFDEILGACASRDGIPLGIVLAAGAMWWLNPAGLAVRLKEKLDLPYDAPADVPAHQAKLEAAISWSWNLLSGDEQTLLMDLAAFAGGFTAPAAAAVDDLTPEATEGLLSRLSRKSLIEARPDAAGGPRFDMLSTIRVFARMRLELSDRFTDVQRRHAAFFAAAAAECGRGLTGPAQVRCAQAFRDEFENFEAAFEWSSTHDPPSALALAASLWRCFLLGDMPVGRRWLDDAIGLSPEPTPTRASALAGAGALAWMTGDAAAATRRLAEAAELAERLDLKDVDGLVRVNQGALAEQQSRLDDAEHWFTSALSVYARSGDQRGRAVALNGLGMVWRRRGDNVQAWPLWSQAAALFNDVGDGTNEAIALGNKAWAAEVGGRFDEAKGISHECRRIQIALGDVRGLAATTAALGRIALEEGQLDEAKQMQFNALDAFIAIADRPWVASTLLALATIAAGAGSHAIAAKLLGAAQAVWAQIGSEPREEERARLDHVSAECRAFLDPGNYQRAIDDGRLLNPSAAASVARANL
jgi:predicted ATPase